MKTLQELEKEIEDLNQRIKAFYYDQKERNIDELIGDGISNIEEYYITSPKILWILKEAYGKGGGIIADLFYPEFMLGTHRSLGTWHPIIYTSYAILNNNITCYDDMSFIREEPAMIDVLQKIAFINVSKFPGGTTSKNYKISQAYLQDKAVLLEQIKVFNPDIIIGGNTIKNFVPDLGLNEETRKYDEYIFWLKNGKIYIDADHPSRKRGIEWQEEYVDSILNIVRKNFE